MQKRIRINYKESSKAVTPDVTIEYLDETGESIVNEDVLQETYALFEAAQQKMLRQNIDKINSTSKLP